MNVIQMQVLKSNQCAGMTIEVRVERGEWQSARMVERMGTFIWIAMMLWHTVHSTVYVQYPHSAI
jgi:hypothetical protein